MNLYLAKKYAEHTLLAKSKFQVHSPFVYTLIEEVFENQESYYAFSSIELVRSQLIASKEKIVVTDLGAGSKNMKSNQRLVKQIAKCSLKNARSAQLLFLLTNYFKSDWILELGTSLGVSTAYLAKARKSAKIITCEGCPEIARLARKNFKLLGIENIVLLEGNFNDTLPVIGQKLEQLDFIFIDGNHTKKATLEYFEMLLPLINENTVVVLDDIYWSKEMTEAWNTLIQNDRVMLSLDVFTFGILFFKTNRFKEHFKLKVFGL